QDLGVARDAGQRCVDLVRHLGRQPSDRGQMVLTQYLFLPPRLLRDVVESVNLPRTRLGGERPPGDIKDPNGSSPNLERAAMDASLRGTGPLTVQETED